MDEQERQTDIKNQFIRLLKKNIINQADPSNGPAQRNDQKNRNDYLNDIQHIDE